MTHPQFNKVTLAQYQQNFNLIESFIEAFQLANAEILDTILHDKGKYFGIKSKEQAIQKLQSFFTNELSDYVCYKFNLGISLNKLFYSPTTELRCLNDLDDDKMNRADHYYKNCPFGTPANLELDERVYYFCFSFKDNLINKIEIPTKYIDQFDPTISQN